MKIRVLISGRVQGVFYRAHTKKKADEIGLNGWVRNLDDGKIEAVFEGSKEKVDEMIKWCWEGSVGSRVTSVKPIKSIKPVTNEGFEILY